MMQRCSGAEGTKELIRQAAQGEVLHNDNTGAQVLRLARQSDDDRTGVCTRGIVPTAPGWKVTPFFSGANRRGRPARGAEARAAWIPALIRCRTRWPPERMV